MCLRDYETVDHLIWDCERFETDNRRLTDALTALIDVQLWTPVRDLCALQKWQAMSAVWIFWKVLELEFDELAVFFEGKLGKYYLGP
jgi:hypothetical protein